MLTALEMKSQTEKSNSFVRCERMSWRSLGELCRQKSGTTACKGLFNIGKHVSENTSELVHLAYEQWNRWGADRLDVARYIHSLLEDLNMLKRSWRGVVVKK